MTLRWWWRTWVFAILCGLASPIWAQDTAEPSTSEADSSQSSESQATPAQLSEQQVDDQTQQPAAEQPAEPPEVPTIPVLAEENLQEPEGEAATLEDIVVTANKRTETIGEIAGAVSAMSGRMLKGIGATNFQDVATYLPGVSSASRGAGENEIVVRGVAAGNEGQSVSSTVGVYVDELPVGSSSAFGFGIYALDFNPFDLERIELLSGPQGTLYGAASLGGLLKYVTAPPDVNLLAATVQADRSNTTSGGANPAYRGMVNLPWKIPSFDIPIALRVDGFSERNAGSIDDPSRGLTDVDSSKNEGGRASLLMEFTPDLTFRLGAIDQEITRQGQSNVDYDGGTGQPVQGQHDHATDLDEPFLSKARQYSGVLKWAGDWGGLTSVSGRQTSNLLIHSDATDVFGAQFGTGDSYPYLLIVGADLDKDTQEVRANSSWKILDFQLGGFYTTERAFALAHVIAKQPTGDQDILRATLHTTYKETAGFADVTARLTDRLSFGLGARYAKNKQVFQQFASGVLGAVPGDTSEHYSSDKTITYLINPSYRFGESVLVYARAASGYRPGGPNFIVPPPMPPQPPTYGPDTVWNYELGTKTPLLDNRAWLNFAVYRIDWSDIQLLVMKNNLNTLENGGKARVVGSELAGNYLVLPGLTVGGNMSYSRAELVEDVPDLQAQRGDPLPLSPRFGAALTTDYRLPLFDCCSGSAGISYRYIGKRPSGFDGSTQRPQYWLPAYGALDLRAGLQWGSLDVALTLKNALDKIGQISADTAGYALDSSAPVRVAVTQSRTVGLTLTYNY